ncbi:hypothetical protein K402DRAFT_455914 [Aulographum hederae CBS 113979]|uniref:Uncharacterized protein n=1 Tax=Aulographum hederae CBS 113979 TaxID=1176131 RepID=A0A6G1GUM9_9PEZI|nr:hypothetical protein K402DRAFT_455914 [Aulographum hederae CBS 113979]
MSNTSHSDAWELQPISESAGRCYFLKLPRELRDLVYAELRSCSQPPELGINLGKLHVSPRHEDEVFAVCNLIFPALPLSNMRFVSRAIRSEYLETVDFMNRLRTNFITVHCHTGIDHTHKVESNKPAPKVATYTKLFAQVGRCDIVVERSVGHDGFHHVLQRLVEFLPNLHTLRVSLRLAWTVFRSPDLCLPYLSMTWRAHGGYKGVSRTSFVGCKETNPPDGLRKLKQIDFRAISKFDAPPFAGGTFFETCQYRRLSSWQDGSANSVHIEEEWNEAFFDYLGENNRDPSLISTGHPN